MLWNNAERRLFSKSICLCLSVEVSHEEGVFGRETAFYFPCCHVAIIGSSLYRTLFTGSKRKVVIGTCLAYRGSVGLIGLVMTAMQKDTEATAPQDAMNRRCLEFLFSIGSRTIRKTASYAFHRAFLESYGLCLNFCWGSLAWQTGLPVFFDVQSVL